MRNHLLKAFEAKALHPFPGKIIKKCDEIIGRESTRVYCKCRLPDDGRKMKNCMGCKLWIMWIVLSVPKQRYKNMYRGIVKLVYKYLLVLIINYLFIFIYNYQY